MKANNEFENIWRCILAVVGITIFIVILLIVNVVINN